MEEYQEQIKETAKEQEELQWQFEEMNEFGEDGWTISYSYKSKDQ